MRRFALPVVVLAVVLIVGAGWFAWSSYAARLRADFDGMPSVESL